MREECPKGRGNLRLRRSAACYEPGRSEAAQANWRLCATVDDQRIVTTSGSRAECF